ncbi:hypothetical protein YW5DRAFT_00707 [Streptomyces sp. Ncost-T6T-1]|nr:hypothetical protein YW5DRAFT_00707 [Streptomyces sp. Ncost-T6T-1]
MDGRGRRPGLSRPKSKGVRRGHGGAPAHAGVRPRPRPPRQLRNGPFTSYVMPPEELPLVPRCEEK